MTETGQLADLKVLGEQTIPTLTRFSDERSAGMRSAQTTLLDLHTVATGEPEDASAAVRRIPDHQRHIVEAATGYAGLEAQLHEGILPRAAVLFTRDNVPASPVPATQVGEVLSLFGAGREILKIGTPAQKITVRESAIPGYHVQLRQTDTLLEVSAVRRRNAKRILS